jgi:uncharacterized membrane protein YcaP (DUF421 family)
MDFNITSLLIISLKSIAIYLFIVLALRLFGKKELSQLSVLDLVFILLISNSVQNAMVGPDNTLQGGIAAALGLFVINYVFRLLINRFPQFSEVIQGHSLMLVYKGKVINENLRKSMISLSELDAAVREHGVESVHDVDLAVLEVDGNISVLSSNFQHKTVRKRKAHKVLNKQQ